MTTSVPQIFPIPLTLTDENFTPREMEQKAAELVYFLRVPIEDENEKCNFYGFLDPELPNEYYKALFFDLHEENKRLKNMLKRRNSTEASSLEMGQLKEELILIKSKDGLYDKLVVV
ncbi:photosystem I assembly protein ycf4, chloroplast [Artemisia annua]|uniref:Photosystem I assembly protein ycf4, chloroplast n=1 Tax=Artemisia annua TaxID=35608 RepID=A0A2U1NA11_ARTAN|nr:photosystem I assembly protein ycf4, chloroplast [Artemisia annua]